MPWTCPACRSRIIEHRNGDALPRVGVVYRCSLCRLELVYDPDKKRLVFAPGPDDDA